MITLKYLKHCIFQPYLTFSSYFTMLDLRCILNCGTHFGDLEKNLTILQSKIIFVAFLRVSSYIKATLKDEECTSISNYCFSRYMITHLPCFVFLRGINKNSSKCDLP